MKHILIFTHGGGRLANQLMNFAHLLSFQKEHEKDFIIVNMPFKKYEAYFAEVEGSKAATPGLPARIKSLNDSLQLNQSAIGKFGLTLLIRLLHLAGLLLPGWQSLRIGPRMGYKPYLTGERFYEGNLDKEDFYKRLTSKRVTVIAGWPVRAWSIFGRYDKQIREHLLPSPQLRSIASAHLKELRNKYQVLIGVFIRMDDYRTWQKGKYFFEPERYVKWMEQVHEMFAAMPHCFLVSPNEDIDHKQFSHLPHAFVSGEPAGSGSFIENFFELSQCDYIMTPPSTFGAWAAFIGKAKIIPLHGQPVIRKPLEVLNNHLYDAVKDEHMSVAVK